ncbi:DUF4166 domain-containing protein [Conyzicola nivalis]|uniref:DUF4166 domain-containing protein n=1 Tax=Conyzicola nivalis TaxID=1477021 RepID=UPI001E53B4B3|nr:DUF4166 domain-containing protein [Conyzicola nivalis]
MPQSVYQRLLGDDFARLAPELRDYFSAPPAGSVGRGHGVFETAGSRTRWLAPVFTLLARRRILFPEYATDVPFTVTNIPGPGDGLSSRREFHFPGRDRVMHDTMHVIDGRLHDFLGRRGGLEVRLAVTVGTDGALRMASDAAWLHLRGLRLPLPALLSARVFLHESRADGRQRVDVRMRHPLFGEIFRYAGTFSYAYEPLP